MRNLWVETWRTELQRLEEQDLLRTLRLSHPCGHGRRRIGENEYIDLSSNDYLGLANDPRIVAALHEGAERWGVGATASRMLAGHTEAHRALEERLASLKGTEAALVYPSGFQANIGLFSGLAGRHDLVIADRLCHASILDGIRLSGAKLERFRHNDVAHLEAMLQSAGRESIVATESVFSMEGDTAPLPEILEIVTRYDALLIVDEAHATGIFGKQGAGMWEECHLPTGPDVPVILMGTISKALGCQGGFVCGPRTLIDYLLNRSRSFIFSTGMSPALAWAAVRALEIAVVEKERRQKVLHNAELLCSLVGHTPAKEPHTPIIPVLIGDAERTMRISGRLLDRGILAGAIRPPSVPDGTSRLRLSVSAAHRPEDLRHAAGVVQEEIRTPELWGRGSSPKLGGG